MLDVLYRRIMVKLNVNLEHLNVLCNSSKTD